MERPIRGLYVVPRISAEETDWGVTCYAERPGDLVRATAIGMPNIGNVAGGAPPSEEEGWSEFIAWRVPIDDEKHVSFNVHMTHIQGEARERLMQRKQDRPAAQGEPANIVAARILRGELVWSDVAARPDIVNIQDDASQVGQGLIADRAAERLGRSDAGIILLRQVWARRGSALAPGHHQGAGEGRCVQVDELCCLGLASHYCRGGPPRLYAVESRTANQSKSAKL